MDKCNFDQKEMLGKMLIYDTTKLRIGWTDVKLWCRKKELEIQQIINNLIWHSAI